jgi:SAM-dependent methyltransferase
MESLDDTLRRLKRERDEADRRYNDALTSLDRALPPQAEWPSPGPGMDDSQLAGLNTAWDTLAPPASLPGWRGRLTGFIWRTVAPSLQRQATFNSRLVDHLNRNADAAREAYQRAEETAARLREEFARLAEFHSRTIQYLQQVTAYIDTRDRDTAGGALVLNAALSGLAENMSKRWESLAAHDERTDARADALAASYEELRAMVGVAQQASLSVKRELQAILEVHKVQGVQRVQEVQEVQGVQRVQGVHEVQRVQERDTFRTLDSYKYVGFEDQFRGSREEIRARLESYLPVFRGTSDVLDVGCGRGEFLELLAGEGITARGIDVNHEMAELCRSRGLDVAEADAVGYLTTLPDGSLGGIFAAQVVEHLQPDYLLRFLELAFHKLRPGGRIALETLNPACWTAFFESYIRDITHVWPLHPETLKYLVVASGFTRADIEYRSPVPAHARLQPLAVPAGADTTLADLVEAVNANTEKLNARMFTYLDYAVIGAR